ncbi:hypothetical protein MMC26_005472 [Xylographa opegraphella]|nr:hypothetical protein [Xylographa opegraphella]
MVVVNAVVQNHPVDTPNTFVSTPASTPFQTKLDQSLIPFQPRTIVPITAPARTSASSRRHPARQAAYGAHYNLSAKWSSFTEYLVESAGSSGSDEATDDHTTKGKKRRLRVSDILSEDESDSDEYLNSGDGGKKMLRRRVGTKGVDDKEKLRRKKRKAGRLGKADLEVIHGEKPVLRGGSGKKARKAHGEKLDGLTKKEAGRLVEYLLCRTDWADAANHVHGDASVKSEAVKVEPMEAQIDRASEHIAHVAQKSIGPDHLKMHWKETLSKRLLDLYID